MVDFPSVTFCKAYTFNNPDPGFLEEMEKKSAIFDHTWLLNNTVPKEKLFYFFNHENNETGFSCNTVDGSQLSGQPCVFPFTRKDCLLSDPDFPTQSYYCNSFNQTDPSEVFSNCTAYDDVRPWCATRVFKNNSMVPFYYGYCTTNCNGQLPSRRSSKNLASPLYSKLWQKRLFDMDPWKHGHCHTYTSTKHFKTGRQGNLYAYIGDGEKINRLSLQSYYIYLHSSKV